jgi:hypothetical protein
MFYLEQYQGNSLQSTALCETTVIYSLLASLLVWLLKADLGVSQPYATPRPVK